MDEAKVARIRKWVIAICMLVPICCFGLVFFGFRSLTDSFSRIDTDPAVFSRELSEVEASFKKDPTATRKLTLEKMQKDPDRAADQFQYLTYAERDRLAEMPKAKVKPEAEAALKTQLEAMKILESQAPSGIAKFVHSSTLDYSWDDVLKIAVLAKRSDVIRAHAKEWAEAPGFGPFSDDSTRHDGYQFLGWADLVDGDINGAAKNLLRSGDYMDAPTLGSFGPSTELADALITEGRFADVIEWVEKVGKHWEPKICKEWVRVLKKNKRPFDEAWTQQFAY